MAADAIDLIVPTIEGREESLERCLASFPNVNPIIVRGKPTCGQAWIEGIQRSKADYLILCADDIEARMPAYEVCVETIDAGYLPCPVIYRPNGTIESAGGDMGAPGCLLTDIQPDWTPVNFVPLPFVSRVQIDRIGMIPSHYMTDVWASHRGRQLGYETVLRTSFELIHHHHMTGRKSTEHEDRRIFDEAMRDV